VPRRRSVYSRSDETFIECEYCGAKSTNDNPVTLAPDPLSPENIRQLCSVCRGEAEENI
jgi:hypothetical protein